MRGEAGGPKDTFFPTLKGSLRVTVKVEKKDSLKRLLLILPIWSELFSIAAKIYQLLSFGKCWVQVYKII